MTQIDENLDLSTYLKRSVKTVDGATWVAICIATVVCLADVLIGTNWLPLREIPRPGKAVTLLLFTPLLVFLILIVLRQLPFRLNQVMVWIRAALCIFAFLMLNF